MAILSLQGVSKSFGALKVTDDVSFALQPGEAPGILGPNGAGTWAVADIARLSFIQRTGFGPLPLGHRAPPRPHPS